MKVHRLTPKRSGYPDSLKHIASIPKELYYLGAALDDLELRPVVAIVGSRKVSVYGRQITTQLAQALAARGIAVVSGLAMGVDAVAHQAAIEVGGRAIAVLPCGLDRIYPVSNYQLAKQMLANGGTLVTEYPPGTEPFKSNFVARNRIVAGLSNAVLITEAAERSGSLHTANFALEQGKEVLVVPGNITSPLSTGTNNLIKAGAIPVTGVKDILSTLHMATEGPTNREFIPANQAEHIIFKLLTTGISDGNKLLAESGLDTAVYNQTLTMMEITNKIKAAGGDQWILL